MKILSLFWNVTRHVYQISEYVIMEAHTKLINEFGFRRNFISEFWDLSINFFWSLLNTR